jgi:predicted permease
MVDLMKNTTFIAMFAWPILFLIYSIELFSSTPYFNMFNPLFLAWSISGVALGNIILYKYLEK